MSMNRWLSILVALGLVSNGCGESFIGVLSPPQISVNSNRIDFGEVPLESSVEIPITIQNIGQQPLEITRVAPDGDTGAFTLASARADFQILPNTEIDVVLVFSPPFERKFEEQLTISSNASNAAEKTVTLVGEGVSATVCVDCNTPPTNMCITDTSLVVYDPEGMCVDGSCQYRRRVTPCPDGCANGRCTSTSPNRPPSVVAAIVPNPARVMDMLTVTTTTSDPDGDPVTLRFAWTRDQTALPAQTLSVIEASQTARGETWSCTVTPNDGTVDGAPVTVSVTIDNSLPTAPVVSVAPALPVTADDLMCSVTTPSVDADGDMVQYDYAWSNGNQTVAMQLLSASNTSKNETWTCTVTPSDGRASGPAGSASLTVQNSLPTAPTVRISPPNPATADDLTCAVTMLSSDADGDMVQYAYAWSNGASAHMGAALPAAMTAAGEMWTCTVTPDDGQAMGPSGSDAVTIRSRPCADLDKDCFADIVFSNYWDGTNYEVFSLVYLGTANGFTSTANALPTQGAMGNLVSDVNGDGHLDVLFANERNNAGHAVDSPIYWGSPTGPSAGNVTGLPTIGARDVEVADLNGDTYVDIVYANAYDGTSYAIDSYIYWGSASGYSAMNRTALPTRGAQAVAIADLNRDTHLDLVFANSQDGAVYDIDSYIYWGSATGLTAANRSTLPTMGARGVAIDDLDSDGYPDIVFANSLSLQSGSVNRGIDSFIYWGSASGFSAMNRTGVPTRGAWHVQIAQLNADMFPDLVFSNRFDLAGGAQYNVDSYVYWGSAAANYPAAARTALQTHGARASAAADVNNDGETDLVFANHRNTTSAVMISSYLYLGTPTGYSTMNRQTLSTSGASGVSVAAP